MTDYLYLSLFGSFVFFQTWNWPVNLNKMMKFLRFFVSKQFIFNLVAILIIWIVVVVGESMYLKSHTNFGEQINVPTFYKIHMDDLDEFVSDKNITYTIQDSVYMDDWPKGTVCWQYPRPTDSTGMSVKSGREILLTVVPTQPEMIEVPKVVYFSQRMAESSLEMRGFRTKVSFQPDPEAKGAVLKQLYNGNEVKPGTYLPKGSRIELVVAQGQTGEVTSLPNLIGLTISEAKARLSNLTIALYSDCATCASEEEEMNAVITEQSPRGGEGITVSAGATVTVWATKSGQ